MDTHASPETDAAMTMFGQGSSKRPKDGRYSRVSSSFWSDERVRQWPDDVKLLSLYLLTNLNRNLEGIYRLPVGYIVADLGWKLKRVEKAMSILTEQGFLLVDESTDVMIIRNSLKYQAPANEDVIKGAMSRLRDLPKTKLFPQYVALAKKYLFRADTGIQAQTFCQEVQQLAIQMGYQLESQMEDIESKSESESEKEKEKEKEDEAQGVPPNDGTLSPFGSSSSSLGEKGGRVRNILTQDEVDEEETRLARITKRRGKAK